MGQQYMIGSKVCATCAYWTGKRAYRKPIRRCEVRSAMERGMCGNTKGGCANQTKQANATCGRWESWPVLK